jgi:small nuclear ribonucleoprotein (snRNP)-like protein
MRYRPYSYGNNVKNADQIRTYATVLVAFDAKGNLLWDQSMKLDDIEKPALEQVSDYYNNGDEIIFLYKKESELKTKSISVNSDAAYEATEKLKLKDDADEVRDEKENEGGLRHWVDNSFYVFGYQTIRNTNRKDDRVRDVFYINKVVVD